MNIKTKAYCYLIASLLIGSFTPALLVLTIGVNAFELFFLASVISIPFGILLIVKNKKLEHLKSAISNKKTLFFIALAALLSYVPFEYGIAYSEHYISASLATVLFRLNPLLMLVFIPVVLRERLSRKQLLALTLAFVGVVIGVSQGNILGLTNNPDVAIELLVVLLAFGYALSTTIIKWQKVDNEVFISAATFVLTAFFGILFILSGAQIATLNTIELSIIIYLAITNIFSFYMYICALKILKTTIVTNTFMLSPFFTFIWAFLLYGQSIQIYYVAIALLSGLGMLIQRTDTKGGSYVPQMNTAYSFVVFDVTGAFIENPESKLAKNIRSGSRVLATKLNRSATKQVNALMNDAKFTDLYDGTEKFIAKEAEFVKDILGFRSGDVLVIKAGPDAENDEFFDRLNKSLS